MAIVKWESRVGKLTKNQLAEIDGFSSAWLFGSVVTQSEYIKEKYPQVYEAAARIALDQTVIDVACDDMRARIEEVKG